MSGPDVLSVPVRPPHGQAAASPTISVVLATRNRAAQAATCVGAILENQGFVELIVVDQSDDTSTRDVLSALLDHRLRYVASALRGVTSGRNLGIELSRGEVVAFTDDDCLVPPTWVERISAAFTGDPDGAVVCGRVHVPEAIQQRGFATSFEPEERDWQGRFPPPFRGWGITANMAVRRAVFARVGSFDPMLGAGAPLLSGGEPDFLFRVLKAGLKVVNAREVEVEHLGVRVRGQESRDLWRGYGIGTAAALFKHVRLGDADALVLCLRHLGVMALVVTKNILRGARPLGLGYTLAFFSGALASFKFGIDRERKLYQRASRPSA